MKRLEKTPLVGSPDNECYRTLEDSIAIPIQSHPLSAEDAYDEITLSWNDVNVHVEGEKSEVLGKHIIKNVKGIVKPGTLMAIMGASGAGKSTLLNVLTQRNLEGLSVKGSVLVNGADLGSEVAKVSAYVQQDHLFMSTLTVKEHLWFYSQLRIDQGTSKAERESRVQEVTKELGLSECEGVMIGKAGEKKGISGGEKKRLQFASEILTNPALLFCDEPTSGLDSYMAMSVVLTLKKLAAKGKTILCTIHQPSSEIFNLFSSVYLLADGRLAYTGSTTDALEFFKKCGHPCPLYFNAADHYIFTLAKMPTKEEECGEIADKICDQFEESAVGRALTDELKDLSRSDKYRAEKVKRMGQYRAGWFRQFGAVLWRSWIANRRNPFIFRARLTQGLITAFFLGLVYFQQDYDTKGVMNINGAIFLLITTASVGNMLAVLNTFPFEFPIFKREFRNGMYSVHVYYMAKVCAELPIFILIPALLIGVSYYMIGLYNNLVAFGTSVVVLIMVTNVAVSFGYLISSTSSNVTAILAAGPAVVMPLMLFGGFFLHSGTVPVYFVWLRYLSWFNYAFEILTVNQWRHVQNITCNSIDNATYSLQTICYPNGKAVIASYGYSEDNLVRDILILIGMMVGFRILSIMFLYGRTHKISELLSLSKTKSINSSSAMEVRKDHHNSVNLAPQESIPWETKRISQQIPLSDTLRIN